MAKIKCPTCNRVMEKKEDVIYLHRFGECCGCQEARADMEGDLLRDSLIKAFNQGYESYKDYAESEGQWK